MSKTKVISAVCGLTISLSLIVFIYAKNNSGEKQMLANIEALAEIEGGSMFGPMCSKTANPGNYRMKLCSNCAGSYGSYAMDEVAFCPK